MWSDENKIEVFGVNSTFCVWREKKEEGHPMNTIYSVSYG